MDYYSRLIKDHEVADLFGSYMKLVEDKIIGMEDDNQSVSFRTAPPSNEEHGFLHYVHHYHKTDYEAITNDYEYMDIWFLSFYYAEPEEDDRCIRLWLRYDKKDSDKKHISFGSGDSYSRCLSDKDDCKKLIREMSEHLNILLTLKATYYEEYLKCKDKLRTSF